MSSVRYYGRELQHRNVQRRLQQWENAEQCAANYGYFQKVNFITKQHRLWEEADAPGGPRLSRLKAEERQRRLGLRRERLRQLMLMENEQHQAELKELEEHEKMGWSNQPDHDMNRLRGINSELRRQAEERRAHEAELRLYHRWRSEQPVLKHLEDKHRTEFVKKAWVDQVEEKLMREKMKAKEEEEFQAEQQTKLALQEQADKALMEERQALRAEIHCTLQCQVDLLRKKEQQADELRAKEQLMLQREMELENLSQRRRDAEKKKANIELALYFHEHYNLKLKRRAREVKEALEEDQKLLREIEERLMDSRLEEEERREARQQIDRANAVLASYSAIERQIEKDMHIMFHEESRFFWDKQEKRWREDQEARNRLMADTFATLKLQIQECAQKNRRAQESLIHEREDLLRQLENSSTELERIEAELKKKKKNIKHSLDAQVADQSLARLAEIKHQEDERRARLEEMKKEEESLLQEFKRLSAKRPSHPLAFGRKPFALI